MTPEMIGIFVLIALLAGAVFYFQHTAKGEAQLAALEANIKAHINQVTATTPAAPTPVVVVPPNVSTAVDSPATPGVQFGPFPPGSGS